MSRTKEVWELLTPERSRDAADDRLRPPRQPADGPKERPKERGPGWRTRPPSLHGFCAGKRGMALSVAESVPGEREQRRWLDAVLMWHQTGNDAGHVGYGLACRALMAGWPCTAQQVHRIILDAMQHVQRKARPAAACARLAGMRLERYMDLRAECSVWLRMAILDAAHLYRSG